MKTALLTALLATASGALSAQPSRIGMALAGFTLLNVNGNSVRFLARSDRPTVVIFFSTRCPMSNAFNYRRNVLYHDFADRVHFVIVDSNANEPLEEVRNYARSVGFDFPVYRDIKNALADQLGALMTTDTYVLDAGGVVRYHGYMEDSPHPDRAKIKGLRLAMEAVLAGRPVAMPENKAYGCTIVRASALMMAVPDAKSQASVRR